MKLHHALLFVALVHCDKTSDTTTTATSASTTAPVASSAPVASTAPSASAAPSASTSPIAPDDPKNVMVSIKDASAESSKTVKVAVGGQVTVFLGDAPGNSWSVDKADAVLGKAKEETMPGFGPGVNAHQFQWALKTASIKAGETHKVVLKNKKGQTFTLTIETIAG